MNGNPGTLVASHPGNTNAVKQGVYSPRLLEPRIAEIAAGFTESFEFSIVQRIAVQRVASSMAILEAIDRDLDERGVADKRGESRSILNHRSRVARELERWLAQLAPSMERQSAASQLEGVGRSDYVLELQRIALGQDPTAKTGERVSALKVLLTSDPPASNVPQCVNIRIHTDQNGERAVEYLHDPPDDPED